MDETKVTAQIDSEYTYGLRYMQAKWKRWMEQKKVFGNKDRKDSAVGDPLLFTTFSTVLSSIYDDRLDQEFKPAEMGDDDVAECLNALSHQDERVMEMPMLMNDVIFYTLFHSRVVVDMSEFDREEYQTTVPMVVDPMTMIRDPKAISVRGYMGKKGTRFFGYQISLTEMDIEAMPDFKNKNKLNLCKVSRTDIDAAGLTREQLDGSNVDTDVELVGENAEYKFLVWYTRHKGHWYRFYTDPSSRKVIYRALKLKVLPLVDFFINADPTKWDGMSVCDLVEDKQRHRSAVVNAALKQVKKSQNPSYLFDVNKINQKDLVNAKWGAVIPTDGAPGDKVATLPHDPVQADVQWILDFLDQSAQRATATPDQQQGIVGKSNRTLGELNIVASKVDTRFSLTAKLFSFSFGRFWAMWYFNYKEYFAEYIDEKVVRIEGPNGAVWRRLTRENIISVEDPDVYVESKTIAEAKRMNEYNVFSAVHQQSLQDPTYSARNGLKYMASLAGLKKDLINSLYRPTIDELEAEEENRRINDGFSRNADGTAFISIYQDHATHIEKHGELAE